ncbi:MAG: hypothetical protein ABI426_03770 [Flavobacterium sp.]
MLKNILKLEGAQKLSKNEQKEINGGGTGTGTTWPSYCTYLICADPSNLLFTKCRAFCDVI